MVRTFRRAGLAAALLVAVVLGTTASAAQTPLHGTLSELSYHSRALHAELPFELYLPPGYELSGKRYPVIYFLHGLPAGPYGFRNVGPIVRALEKTGRPAIVVAPRGAREGDDDPEYLDWGPGRNWETAIARELPEYVDSHFRTIGNRTGRALVGVSAGGYGAVLLTLHRLQAFSVVESWSGYFRPTNRKGDAVLDLGSRAANHRASAHAFVHRVRRTLARRPTFLAFYVGRGDKRFRAENERLDRELTAARVPHLFRVYPGAHEDSLWQRYARQWLVRALEHLAPDR